ncbi:anaphase-promoting complex subunit CDC26-like [Rhynchophorus ferrugineus]|uniref:Anaphase-promoting complex subunit CDC26 n=1 Tax=Rhynchophorus ferrugineus TaxID=354439 RepID=A0A834I839_RHYFE|nr:hypothetical protein GWI33_018004 [Rhynchophorus ferrugineus]
MLRRPPTAIELKLDDITEYEQHRRKIKHDKLQKSISSDLPSFQTGPKSKQEIYNRIGYNPSQSTSSPS